AELADRLPGLRNHNALVHEGPEGIIFLHRIAPGSADKSYGIHVAERAGVPAAVLERARAGLAGVEGRHLGRGAEPAGDLSRRKRMQASLFGGTEDPVLAGGRQADVGKMPPEQVVELVRRWQRELGAK